ncbi:hypothetical protein C2S51_030917 [Perilla frutescens var. frutescens]|nr:hypothetical protein C2S51_030917 [Perilla frutescens var. frutescens]
MARRGKGANHVWTVEEDAKLVESMVELKRSGNWDGESGTGLKKGHQKELEKILEEKLPGHGLREKPHIESRCKLLKKQYHAIYDVRSSGGLSGFGWDDDTKCSHPDCTFMKHKSFLYYDQLALVWGKDRANGMYAEAPRDVIENLEREDNLNQEDQEFDEDDDHIIPPTTKSRGETSKKPERKRRRSADGLILSLERITDALTSNMDKSNEQLELQKIEYLTSGERQKAAMKLVRDPDLLDYFFTIQDDAEKESFMIELLGEN